MAVSRLGCIKVNRYVWLLLITLLVYLLMIKAVVVVATPLADGYTFPETGHTVSGAFWMHWQQYGGLAVFGYPISEEIQEVSDLNDQTYIVQYFERAVFEEHPENQPPYDILLSQLGTLRYKAKYSDAGAPNQQISSDNSLYFPETKHTIGGIFRVYWQAHGGINQLGFPISDEFVEVSDIDQQSYRVQYFERAVLELHLENVGTQYEVLLAQLGTLRYRQKYGDNTVLGQAVTSRGALKSTFPDLGTFCCAFVILPIPIGFAWVFVYRKRKVWNLPNWISSILAQGILSGHNINTGVGSIGDALFIIVSLTIIICIITGVCSWCWIFFGSLFR